MPNLFLDNAYNVLGLDTSASQKEITKRAKDIINLLRIDEHSEYKTDFAFAKVKREEGKVKEAVQRLSSPTKRIQEYFFCHLCNTRNISGTACISDRMIC